MNDEPVRLPVWASTIIGTAIGLAVALLLAPDVANAWRPSLAQALLTVAPVFGAVEIARRKVTPTVRADRQERAARAAGRAAVVSELEQLTATAPQKKPPRRR